MLDKSNIVILHVMLMLYFRKKTSSPCRNFIRTSGWSNNREASDKECSEYYGSPAEALGCMWHRLNGQWFGAICIIDDNNRTHRRWS